MVPASFSFGVQVQLKMFLSLTSLNEWLFLEIGDPCPGCPYNKNLPFWSLYDFRKLANQRPVLEIILQVASQHLRGSLAQFQVDVGCGEWPFHPFQGVGGPVRLEHFPPLPPPARSCGKPHSSQLSIEGTSLPCDGHMLYPQMPRRERSPTKSNNTVGSSTYTHPKTSFYNAEA